MYEIRIYATRQDFYNYNATSILDGLQAWRGALKEARRWLSDNEVVKVQSDDREFIQVLTKDGKEV